MASLPKNTLTIIFYVILLSVSSFSHLSNGVFSEKLSEAISMKQMAKQTHLRFFFHDSPSSPSVIQIAGSSETMMFGDTFIFDDDLTEEQDPSSKSVGKAQGMGANAALNGIGPMMVMTCVFTEGEFNGSSISVLGRDPWLEDVRELPVVGGSGRFRYATGYALLHNVFLDLESGDATVEFNVYVRHY